MVANSGRDAPTDPVQHAIALLRGHFVQRYTQHKGADVDGLPPGKGAFLACTFWLADNYALVGRHDEARETFERLPALRNDVGLLSEEYDTAEGRLVGNFPQAFSHVPLIDTARTLSSALAATEARVHEGLG
jgi:GH15 family glucan-1,4-alpha-glucosidase